MSVTLNLYYKETHGANCRLRDKYKLRLRVERYIDAPK